MTDRGGCLAPATAPSDMESSPIRSIAVLGLLGALGLMLMMLMSLSGMTDSAAAGLGQEIQRSFARSLDAEPGAARVTMIREGGAEGTPRYTVHLKPSVPVASDRAAVDTLLRRSAEFVSMRVERAGKGPLVIVCVAHLGGDARQSQEYLRTTTVEGRQLERRDVERAARLPTPEAAPRPAPPSQAPPAKPDAPPPLDPPGPR